MRGIRGRSKERGSNTIAWTEEIIVGSNDAAVAAETWKWEHEAEGREPKEEGARTTLASSFSSSPLAALFFTVVVFSAITITIIIVINATHTCHASKCAVPKYGSPPAVATNAEDGAV